jgi:hypothetical protein
MKRASVLLASLLLCTATAQAKDVVMAPAEYRMFNVMAARGHEKQCVAVTDGKDLLARFVALGVGKPEAVVGLIDPPLDWTQSAVLLLYQPDPPPEVVPKVRTLLKDVNKEKLTLLFRYADPNEPPPPPPPPPPPTEPTQPRAPALATRFSMKAVTIGIDDTRDRTKLRSPLLLVVIPKLPFLTSKSPIDCTQKL